jgi:predicted transcriptional regulator
VVSCSEEADIQEVKRLMEDKQVRRLVITNQQGRCTGIVSLGDVAMSLGGQEAGEVLKEVVGVAHPQR